MRMILLKVITPLIIFVNNYTCKIKDLGYQSIHITSCIYLPMYVAGGPGKPECDSCFELIFFKLVYGHV